MLIQVYSYIHVYSEESKYLVTAYIYPLQMYTFTRIMSFDIVLKRYMFISINKKDILKKIDRKKYFDTTNYQH